VLGEGFARYEQPFVDGDVLPSDKDEAAAGTGRSPQVGERGDRVGEEHDPEAGNGRVEGRLAEGVDLGVGLLECGVREPDRASSEPKRCFQRA
jgi:hypothetical protein